MSEPVIITIPHRLGKDEALRRLRPALSKVSESFPVLKVEGEAWSGDRLVFRVRRSAKSRLATFRSPTTTCALKWHAALWRQVGRRANEHWRPTLRGGRLWSARG
jgi:hypothetical protein